MLKYRQLRANSPEDIALLTELFFQTPRYSEICEGRPPQADDALDALLGLPPGKDIHDKYFEGFWLDNKLIGCADLIRGYPDSKTAFIGLLLFAESHQGRGHGVEALAHISELARSWQCTQLRLAVIETNTRALAFWEREGFRLIGRKSTTQYTGDALIFDREVN